MKSEITPSYTELFLLWIYMVFNSSHGGVKGKKQQANKELSPLLLYLLSRYYLLAP